MGTQNSINHTSNPFASTAFTIDPGASGDSYTQYSINGTPEFRIGVDDDAADSFKISQGNALGANDTFIMSAAGERIMPLQPAVLAYLPSDDNNVTGNGATWTLGSTTALTEIFDQSGDFNTNGTFTAPVTGRYYIHVEMRTDDVTAAMTTGSIQIVTSNRTYTTSYINPGAAMDTALNISFAATAIADMDATDTATTTITLSNGAGNTAAVDGGAGITTFLNIFLLC